MHKTKDGKVMASLTEVKNQTGNIFTAADRYGEVYITSYNKVRYRIIKEESDELDIAPRTKRKVRKMEETPEEVTTPVANVEFTPEPIKEVVVDELEEVVTPTVPTPAYQEPEVAPQETSESTGTDTLIAEWDRNSSLEKNFVRQATKTLLP